MEKKVARNRFPRVNEKGKKRIVVGSEFARRKQEERETVLIRVNLTFKCELEKDEFPID